MKVLVKVGDLVERRYETGQYGPNAIGLVVGISSCQTPGWSPGSALFQYADDGTTEWIAIEDLEMINESR